MAQRKYQYRRVRYTSPGTALHYVSAVELADCVRTIAERIAAYAERQDMCGEAWAIVGDLQAIATRLDNAEPRFSDSRAGMVPAQGERAGQT